jgi:Ribosomal protein S7e
MKQWPNTRQLSQCPPTWIIAVAPNLADSQVPFRLLKSFHKVQLRLVRELEKKFSGRDVVIIGNRRIMAPPKSGYALARPRSRTLTAVRLVPPVLS